MGEVYEYFLGSSRGREAGVAVLYPAGGVVKVIVEVLEPSVGGCMTRAEACCANRKFIYEHVSRSMARKH